MHHSGASAKTAAVLTASERRQRAGTAACRIMASREVLAAVAAAAELEAACEAATMWVVPHNTAVNSETAPPNPANQMALPAVVGSRAAKPGVDVKLEAIHSADAAAAFRQAAAAARAVSSPAAANLRATRSLTKREVHSTLSAGSAWHGFAAAAVGVGGGTGAANGEGARAGGRGAGVFGRRAGAAGGPSGASRSEAGAAGGAVGGNGCGAGNTGRSTGATGASAAAASDRDGPTVRLQRLFVLTPRGPVVPAGFDTLLKAVWPSGYSPAQCLPYFLPDGSVSSTQCRCDDAAVPRSVVTLDPAADRRTAFFSAANLGRVLAITRDTLPSYSPMFAVRHEKLTADLTKIGSACVSACWLAAEFEEYLLPGDCMLSKDMLFRTTLYNQVLYFWTWVWEHTKLHCATHRGTADMVGEGVLGHTHACFA